MKVLLVHPPFPDQQSLIAGGLFAIAEYLTRHSHPSEIIHLGIESKLDSSFSIRDYVAGGEFDLVGISMHWCQQIPTAIETAKNLRDLECRVVIGGHAASHFAREILHRFDFIDFIVKGDGEEPLLRLCNELEHSSRQFRKIPNLLYRVNRQPMESETVYSADTVQLEKLNFSGVEQLRNYRHYVAGLQHRSIRGLFDKPCFFLLPGRGCRFNCTYCGGNRTAQRQLHHRSDVSFRSPEKVLETVVSAYERGFRYFHTCFDPQPNGSYYREIFSLIRQRGLEIGFIFESFGLPDESFLEEFADTFSPGMIIISPESASERVRKLNKTLFFTNRELENTLLTISRLGLLCHLYYGYFLPYDREEDICKTLLTIGSLEIKYRHFLQVFYAMFDDDPCAPYRLDPDSFDMTGTDDSLDYYLTFKPGMFHKIPHPVHMSDDDALRLSRLIVFFRQLITQYTNVYQYVNQKSPSRETFLNLLEEWIVSHSGDYREPEKFLSWMFKQLNIKENVYSRLLSLDRCR